MPQLPRLLIYNRFNAWGRQRELPEFPQQSFRELYRAPQEAKAMSSKQAILDSIRRCQPAVHVAPRRAPEFAPTTYADPVAQFARVLAEVGGHCVNVADATAANALLAQVPAWTEGREAAFACARRRRFDVRSGRRGRSARVGRRGHGDYRRRVRRGRKRRRLGHRRAGTAAGDLLYSRSTWRWSCLAATIVHNMHEAYGSCSFDSAGFGVFISGPSKTADIEQSLVIGAPRAAIADGDALGITSLLRATSRDR